MSSTTIASLLLYASSTTCLVAQFNRWFTLFLLLLPYFEAILLILASFLLNEPTISLVVSAILTAFDRSYWMTLSSFPYVRLRRFLSRPAVPVHSISFTSLERVRLTELVVSVNERTFSPSSERTFWGCPLREISKYLLSPCGTLSIPSSTLQP